MNIKIKENKYKASLILLGLFLISGWFYWFQFRPSQIKASCQIEADDYYNREFDREDTDKDHLIDIDSIDWFDKHATYKYQSCLHRNGL